MQEGIIEPLKGGLKKLFNKKIPKNEKVFFILNGDSGQALVITEKRVAILKSSFFANKFDSFPISRFLKLELLCWYTDSYYGKPISINRNEWPIFYPYKNNFQIKPLIGDSLSTIEEKRERLINDFTKLPDDLSLKDEDYVCRDSAFYYYFGNLLVQYDKDEPPFPLALITFPQNKELLFKKAYSHIQEKVSIELKKIVMKLAWQVPNPKEKASIELKNPKKLRVNESERKKKQDKLLSVLFSKLPEGFEELAIEKEIDKLFSTLPVGLGLWFVGDYGLGKRYQLQRLSEKYHLKVCSYRNLEELLEKKEDYELLKEYYDLKEYYKYLKELGLEKEEEVLLFVKGAMDEEDKEDEEDEEDFFPYLDSELSSLLSIMEKGYVDLLPFEETKLCHKIKVKVILATIDTSEVSSVLKKHLIRVNFKPYSPEEIMLILKRFFLSYAYSFPDEFEHFLTKAKEDVLWTIARNCGGKPGLAIYYAQKLIDLTEKVKIETALEILESELPSNQSNELNSESIKAMSPFEFQKWAIKALGGKESDSKVGDMGIDGIIEGSNFWQQEGVIQVKQSEKIGRNVVDNFETAMRRAKYKRGYIVAYSFTNGALDEARRAKNEEGLDIKLLTIEEILQKLENKNRN